METTKNKLQIDVNDPRIDKAFGSKLFDELFELIEQHPKLLTLDRLEKFIRRCATDKDAVYKMRDFLNDRFDYSRGKKMTSFWNNAIILAMIECHYCNERYSYNDLVYLVEKFDDSNALRLGYQWFKNSGYSHQRDSLYKLKGCFTPEYVKKRLEEGYYREILTLAALQTFELPKDLTELQKENLRKHVLEVVTANYYETNINAAETYHKDRIERSKTLFKQCPDLFTVENIVAVALSSHELAQQIYESRPKEQKKISQETISKLLDNKQCEEAMMWLILWYRIRLNKENRKKIYGWVKFMMGCDSHHKNKTIDLFEKLRKRYKIIVSFDEFLDAMVSVGDKKDLDIEGYTEKRFMNRFFYDYNDHLSVHCNYFYRSGLEKHKKQIIMDLFFWKYLPWNMLHREEKVALNDHIQLRAEEYPKQALKLARKYPKIVTLTEKSKFAIFCTLAKKDQSDDDSGYKKLNFGAGISNEIVLSAEDFRNLAVKDIDKLYRIMQIPQIKIDKELKTFKRPKSLWPQRVYKLILLQKQQWLPKKNQAFELLKDFSESNSDNHNDYFIATWKALPENMRPSPMELCILENNKQFYREPRFTMFVCLLKNKLITLDELMIKKLMHMYNDKHDHIQEVADITKSKELKLQITNYKIKSILND
jgi:hypothetical protein